VHKDQKIMIPNLQQNVLLWMLCLAMGFVIFQSQRIFIFSAPSPTTLVIIFYRFA
jgi:hypothetical protein